MKDLLLIVDMQNVYWPGQPWECPSMPQALREIQKLLDHPACGRFYDAVFTRYLAPQDPEGCWKQYNEAHASINSNPYLNQIVPALQPYLMKWPFYDKSTYSSCSIPELQERLSRYDRILLCGVVAECCVLSTAQSLIDAGKHVFYLRDAVAGQDASYEEMACTLLERFSPIHTQLMTAGDYLTRISARE